VVVSINVRRRVSAPQLKRGPLGGTRELIVSRYWHALCTLVAVLACGPTQGQEFRGLWIAQNDGAAFQPCGRAEKWWIEMDSALEASATAETTIVFIGADSSGTMPTRPEPPPLPPPSFIALRGDTSQVGAYGPGGTYSRQILVHDMDDTTGHCP